MSKAGTLKTTSIETRLSFCEPRLNEKLAFEERMTSRKQSSRFGDGIFMKCVSLGAFSKDAHFSSDFQVFFPETASKFNAATMIAKDQPNVDDISTI
jgi:hypothetical protein